MGGIISVKHSFNCGDAITILPGLQHIYRTKGIKTIFMQQLNFRAFYYEDAVLATKDKEGNSVCQNEETWAMLKPLIEAQEYIERCEIWEGQKVDIDFDASRDRKYIPMPNGSIHHWAFFIAPQLQCDLTESWISAKKVHCIKLSNGTCATIFDKVIVNRTERYYNPYMHYYFLKQYESQLIFAGTKREHEVFCTKWKLDIPLLIVNDFLELTGAIKSSRGFIGNQSLCWHISDSIHKKRVLEFCAPFPNTFPTGANGKIFANQEGAEIYVHELFNKT